jgi:hypothetical protein
LAQEKLQNFSIDEYYAEYNTFLEYNDLKAKAYEDAANKK